ncbi:MAG: TonB-dependent receptor [Crocinitomicaceae bacterium]
MSMVYAGALVAYSQPDSLKNITTNTVVVTSYQNQTIQETCLNIQAINIDENSVNGHYNLSDALAEEEGVEVLSSGIGISKPVIRGLSGNRILVLMSGLKFDNQQWQEEHGLGLSDFGLSTVEIIKGPISVLYGSEAVGGVINLIEENKPKEGTSVTDLGFNFNTNTMGFRAQAGFKTNHGEKWWRIRVGTDNHADYTDGNNNRVLNSRFDGYYVKGTYGFKKGNWISTNNYMSSFNRFGFIFNDIYSFVVPDNRWSRNLSENPAHMVILNILSSENSIYLKNGSKLNINLGVQSNERMENEGGGAISLNMHLITAQYLVKWEKELNDNNQLIISGLGSFENNTNFGARKIVPDANMQEANISFFVESKANKVISFENGLGVGEKFLQTKLTPNVNDTQKEIDPFTKFSPYYNFFTGMTYHPTDLTYIKFNLSSGVRMPNLAELSSDGLHEGVFTYEIGDPTLKNEQSFSANMMINLGNKFVQFSVNPFYNYFLNYVYLTPVDEQWYGFPVYRYKQQDARQYGFEAGLNTQITKDLAFKATYAGMESRTISGEFTPFIPAQKIDANISYTFHLSNDAHSLNVFSKVDYYFDQYHLAPFEVGTPQYWLLRGGISTFLKFEKTEMDISVVGNNLLNTTYYSHLSRFKTLGLFNVGRSFSVNFKIRFNNKTKN